jgi:hypothetical protein
MSSINDSSVITVRKEAEGNSRGHPVLIFYSLQKYVTIKNFVFFHCHHASLQDNGGNVCVYVCSWYAYYWLLEIQRGICVGVTSNEIMYIPNFVKISHQVLELNGHTLAQSMVIVQVFFGFILEGSLQWIYETNSGNASLCIRFICLSPMHDFKEWHLTLSKHRNILKKTDSCGLCHLILKTTAWCTYDT